jgi:hypothetical protein
MGLMAFWGLVSRPEAVFEQPPQAHQPWSRWVTGADWYQPIRIKNSDNGATERPNDRLRAREKSLFTGDVFLLLTCALPGDSSHITWISVNFFKPFEARKHMAWSCM